MQYTKHNLQCNDNYKHIKYEMIVIKYLSS